MTNKIDTVLKAINDRITGALPSDTVKNPKLNVNSTSPVLSTRSYPTKDPQCSSRSLNSINAIRTCSKQTSNLQKDQLQTVNKIGASKLKEPVKALKDEFKDLHLNLPILEVLAHAPMYNAMLDKYVESLKLGKNSLGDFKPFDTLADLRSCVNLIPLYLFKKLKIGLLEETDHVFGLADRTKSYPVRIVKNIEVHIGRLKLLDDFYVIDKDPATPLLIGRGFLTTADAIIDYRNAKIAVGEGVTRPISGVKEIDLGEEEEIARDAELNPFEDVLVFRRMVEFLGVVPINLKRNMLYLMRIGPGVLRSFIGRLLDDDLARYHMFLLHY
ncbi:DNA-directed DNA polymerase [Tanacetum coccineum]